MQEKCERFKKNSPLAGGCSVGLDAFRCLCNVKCLCTSSVGGQGTTLFVKYGVGFIGLAVIQTPKPKRQPALLTRDKVFAGSSPPKFLEISSNFFLERTALEMVRWGCSDPARIRYTPMTKNGTSRPEKPRNGVLPEGGVKKRYKA